MSVVLRIKKKSQNETLTVFLLLMPFCLATLIEFIGMPAAVKYCADIVWIFMLITIGVNRFRVPNLETRKLLNSVVALLVITIIGFIINGKSPIYYLWGFRNNFRFLVYFFACIMFVKRSSIEEILVFFDKLYYVNFAVILFQYFVLGKKQDFLGGIFGVQSGCNGKVIVFICIIVARSVLNYLNHRESVNHCLVKCVISMVIAALAELKIYFVIFVLIVIAAMLITEFSMRKLMIAIFTIVCTFLGINLIINIFPSLKNWFNIGSMLATATSAKGYTGQGDMNRLTCIPIAWEMFLTTWPKRLFGLGLGNCDTSSFSLMNTAFYQSYGYLRYNWFSVAFMFLETGIVGLVCYCMFFVKIYVYAFRREKRGASKKEWCQLTRIMAALCLIFIVYNSSMRVEEAYIMYFILALPFIGGDNLKGGKGTPNRIERGQKL